MENEINFRKTWIVDCGFVSWFPHKHWGKRRLKSTLSFCGFVLILWKTYIFPLFSLEFQQNVVSLQTIKSRNMMKNHIIGIIGPKFGLLYSLTLF